MYFYPTQSHNGYLEMVNDLGFVGLTCLLLYLVYWIRQSLQLMKLDRGQGVLFLGLFFQQAITNLTESTWLAINSAFAIAVGRWPPSRWPAPCSISGCAPGPPARRGGLR